MTLHDPSHPIWNMLDFTVRSIIRPCILTAALALILWLTAADFDESEGRTIAGFLTAAIGAEGIGALGSKLFGGKGA